MHPASRLAALVFVLLGAPAAAHAGDDPALASFAEGRRLASQGQCAAAIPRFVESLRHERTVGALLNLGECYERVGRVASAMQVFRDVQGLAPTGDPRHDEAASRAAALSSRVPTLTITLARGDVLGLTIRRDGEVLARDAWELPAPMDPGEHAITATAPERRDVLEKVRLREGEHRTVTVDLEPLATPAAPAAVQPSASAEPQSGSRRTVAYLLGTIGLAGIGVGATAGVVSLGRADELKQMCPSYPACDASVRGDAMGLDARGRAAGDVATATLVGGGVALAAGVVLLLLSPKATSSGTGAPRGVVPSRKLAVTW